MNPDEASVADRLAAFNQRFDEILKLLTGQLPLGGEAKQRPSCY
ncbi:MAG TPA: hypothetical protein VD866_23175 [Urbifossiella sp.]|nr:hypothetical protein [Urbifossiella sp.]